MVLVQTKSDREWLRELGRRVQQHRLNRNFSQVELAELTGVARKTITNLETGHGCTLQTLIALLRGLGLLNQLEAFIPEPGPSPMQLVKLAGKRRQRATGRRKAHGGAVEEPPQPWTWGPKAGAMARVVKSLAEVILWGRVIGAVAWDAARGRGGFEYAAEFVPSGIQVSPLTMPLRRGVFEFPELPFASFHGLPGMLADALPDRFGNLLIDQWLVRQGRVPEDFNPVERLCYQGARGMGALEFRPSMRAGRDVAAPLEVAALVELANEALARRVGLAPPAGADGDEERAAALRDILRVGTSAGGARAKAVVAWNPVTGEFRSGQVDAPAGFEHWLLKFDGVSENRDKEALADPLGYGKIEYAYHLMARAAGVVMSDCRLHEENGRAHFMTRRFDRPAGGGKLHLQSLCALAHYDFNQAGAYAYEQAFEVARALGLPPAALEELFRRAVLNLVARNQDDHTKNIAFLMDKAGRWSLAPAYDVAYSYNPAGRWTARHQMTLNGKTDDFELADVLAFARAGGIKTVRAKTVVAEVVDAVRRWPEFAEAAGVAGDAIRGIAAAHRLELGPG